MGRPEPCVLFAQTFVHNELDEYVDEVVFTEPVVITSCEFLEQNSSSLASSVALIGRDWGIFREELDLKMMGFAALFQYQKDLSMYIHPFLLYLPELM